MINTFVSRNIWKTAFLPLLDFTNLLIAAGVAYLLRYKIFESSFESAKLIDGNDYLSLSIGFSFIIVLIIGLLGGYSISKKPRTVQNIINIVTSIVLSILLLTTYLYFGEYNPNSIFTRLNISRFVIGIFGLLSISAVLFGRLVFYIFERILYKLDIGTYDVLVIGGDNNNTLYNYFTRIFYAKKIYVYDKIDKDLYENTILPFLNSGNCGEIYINDCGNEYVNEISTIAERNKIRFCFEPSGYKIIDHYKIKPIQIMDLHYYETYHTSISGWNIVLKRLFDLFFSLCFITVFSPLYLIIAIAIKIDSKGSVFYSSERVGPNGKVFKMLKFRRFKTEFNTSESDPNSKEALEYEEKLIKEQGEQADRGALYKIKSDPRTTKVGRFLEKTSLDELPQFFNVVVGNLSLVGPRAHQPREVKKYLSHHYKVLNIKPGITGLAQIRGRSDLHFEDEVKLDTYYVQNWSFILDLIILFQTPFVIIFPNHKS